MVELKKYKKTLILTSVIMLLPMLVGILLWEQLPEQMATHFAFDGAPNGWTSRGFTVFGMPLFLLGCQWFCAVVTSQDPKYKNINGKIFSLILWIAGGFLMLINVFLKWDWLIAAVIITAVVVPTIYSYLYYRKHKLDKED